MSGAGGEAGDRPPSRLLKRLLAGKSASQAPAGEPPIDLTDPGQVIKVALDFLLDVSDLIADLEIGAVSPDAADVISTDLAWAAADLVQGLTPGAVAGPAQAPAVLGARVLKRARWDGSVETATFRLFQGAASELMPPTLAVLRGQAEPKDALVVVGRLAHRITAVVVGIKESDLPPLPDPEAFR